MNSYLLNDKEIVVYFLGNDWAEVRFKDESFEDGFFLIKVDMLNKLARPQP